MEIAVLKFFESIRTPFLDFIFACITFMGEEVFLVVLIGIIYFAISKRYGEFLIFNVFTSFTVNGLLKDTIKRPRPYSVIEGFEKVHIDNFLVSTEGLATSYSFPSGHSQISATVFSSLAHILKKKSFWIVTFVAVLLIMVSRLYLGVHYPSDVIVGCLIGFSIPLLWLYVFKKHYNIRHYILIIFCLLMMITLFFNPTKDTFTALGALLGFSLGSLIENKYIKFEINGNIFTKILRCVLGIGLLLALRSLLKIIFPAFLIFDFIRYALMIFICIGIYPFLFKKFKF